ncbi:hypothetical protein [Pseudofrankia asymbiotica]|nr:hypothetical protein [Pseudofrankia asymbiotica]
MNAFAWMRMPAASAVLVACLALLLGACDPAPTPSSLPSPTPSSLPSPTPSSLPSPTPSSLPSSSATEPKQLGPAVPYDLYTHCGISEARYEGRYYELVPPLTDAGGNPPAGWGNPSQPGTLTPVSETEVAFTDGIGHRVTFTLRPGATGWKRICA